MNENRPRISPQDMAEPMSNDDIERRDNSRGDKPQTDALLNILQTSTHSRKSRDFRLTREFAFHMGGLQDLTITLFHGLLRVVGPVSSNCERTGQTSAG